MGAGLIMALFLFGFVGIGAGIMGNQWFTEQGVFREIKLINPEVTGVVGSTRNVYGQSIIKTQLKDGSRQDYLLGSNILFNYTISRKP